MTVLNKKQSDILFELIRCFIRFGNPVGSSTLAESMAGQNKPSTLRYSLGKLEEAGYVKKAHASSGRLPTDKAYRAFIRAIIDRATISQDEETNIRQAMGVVRNELKTLITRACDVMSVHSELMSVVVAPEPNIGYIDIIRLVPVSMTSLLAIVITGDEVTHTRIIHLPIEVNRMDLSSLERSLNTNLTGKRLFDIDEQMLGSIFNSANVNQFLKLNIKRPLEEFLREMRFSTHGRLTIQGRERIVSGPETNPEQIRGILELLENEEQLLALLTTLEGDSGIKALIGSDFTLDGLERTAMIFSDFETQGPSRGKIGVLGPRRMQYERVVPLVKLISDVLEEKIRSQPLVIE